MLLQDASLCSRTNLFVPKDDFPINPGWVSHDSRCSTKKPPEGLVWVQGRLTKKQVITRPGNMLAGRLVKHVKKALSAKTQIRGQKKNAKLDAARERRAIYTVLDEDLVYEEIMNSARRTLEIRRASANPLQKSPNQPTRMVQTGRDIVRVIGLKLKRQDSTSSCSEQDHETKTIE